MTPKEIFLKSIEKKTVTRKATGSATSVITTDLMEKCGVFFPEAHRNPDAMARLSLAAHEIIGFDNVMPLYSVWHESAALGCKVDWGTPSRMPDSHGALCRVDEQIPIPENWISRPEAATPLQAIAILRKKLGNDAAVLGKVFGPWTLGYHVFGVEEFLVQTLLDPDAVKKAMETLLTVTLEYARAQLDAGADAIVLADHATADLCSPDAYRDFLLATHQEIKETLKCPIVLHICGNTSDRISYIARTGIDCFHFDSKVPAPIARGLTGDKLALMGGTSNFDIVRTGTPEAIGLDVKEKVRCGIDIIGPECAVPLDAPYANLKILAEEAKKY